MACSTGKIGYFSEDEVQEALIRSHIKFVKSASNYYSCHDCGEFHLTSGGAQHPLISDPKVQERIRREKQTQDWERKLKR